MSRQRRWNVGRGEHLPRRFTRQVHEGRGRQVHVRGTDDCARSQNTPHLLGERDEERSGCTDGAKSESAATARSDNFLDRGGWEIGIRYQVSGFRGGPGFRWTPGITFVSQELVVSSAS